MDEAVAVAAKPGCPPRSNQLQPSSKRLAQPDGQGPAIYIPFEIAYQVIEHVFKGWEHIHTIRNRREDDVTDEERSTREYLDRQDDFLRFRRFGHISRSFRAAVDEILSKDISAQFHTVVVDELLDRNLRRVGAIAESPITASQVTSYVFKPFIWVSSPIVKRNLEDYVEDFHPEGHEYLEWEQLRAKHNHRLALRREYYEQTRLLGYSISNVVWFWNGIKSLISGLKSTTDGPLTKLTDSAYFSRIASFTNLTAIEIVYKAVYAQDFKLHFVIKNDMSNGIAKLISNESLVHLKSLTIRNATLNDLEHINKFLARRSSTYRPRLSTLYLILCRETLARYGRGVLPPFTIDAHTTGGQSLSEFLYHFPDILALQIRYTDRWYSPSLFLQGFKPVSLAKLEALSLENLCIRPTTILSLTLEYHSLRHVTLRHIDLLITDSSEHEWNWSDIVQEWRLRGNFHHYMTFDDERAITPYRMGYFDIRSWKGSQKGEDGLYPIDGNLNPNARRGLRNGDGVALGAY